MKNYNVIIVEPKNEGNLGAIARICNNFKIEKLILISPQIGHLSETAKIRAKHSKHILERAEILTSFTQVRDRFHLLIGTSAKAGPSYGVLRQPLYPRELIEIKKETQGEIGIVFGREDCGLSNEELKLCDFIVTIPVPGEHRVLNLSHAVAIILYELWREEPQSVREAIKEEKAGYIERKLLFDIFTDIVSHLQYEKYRKPIVQHTFQTIVNRSYVSREELHNLIGVFKKIQQKIKESS